MLAAGPAAAMLSACGRRRAPDRLALWAQDVEGDNCRYLLPDFTVRGGGAVDLQRLAWTTAHEKLLTAFAGGSLPDVMMIARDWVAEFATIGLLAPAPASLMADQFPDAGRAMAYRGRPWSVPWTLDTQVLFYRRDLLADAGHDRPPERLDEWRAMLRDVKRRGRAAHAILMHLDWPEHLFTLAAQYVALPLRDGQTRGDFRSAGFRSALAFYKSLFDEGLTPIVTSTDVTDPSAELARGTFALYPSGAWQRADLERRDLMPHDRWTVARMPGIDRAGRCVIAGAVLGVAHDAADPARAWTLVRYLTGIPAQLRLHALAGTLPSRPEAWRAGGLARDPIAATFAAALADPAPSPSVPEWPRIRTEVQAIAERMVRGQLTLDAAVTAMDARADALLAKRRWLLDRGRIA
ncbi:MAG: extracellular solute-binding protein [Janthinobacterium lividum]